MRLLKSLAPLFALLLAGCATNSSRQEYQTQLDALWAGKQLVVKQPITVPGNISRIEYMGGAQVDKVKRFEPICRLEVNSFAQQPREIPAGDHPVQSVSYRTSTRGGPSARENNVATFTIVLQDSRNEVRSLVCTKESQGQVWRMPTPEQINTILGPTSRFE
ncbi:MAG: hypothetical protein U9Q71_02845 [Pseudomonadota bacterium]|nr:hypothetical protein [Pseudomonadota bacterium]